MNKIFSGKCVPPSDLLPLIQIRWVGMVHPKQVCRKANAQIKTCLQLFTPCESLNYKKGTYSYG